jgi:hypothetical protein
MTRSLAVRHRQWKRINCKQSARWQHLSRLKASRLSHRKLFCSMLRNIANYTRDWKRHLVGDTASLANVVQLTLNQVCQTLKRGNWTVERDEDLTGPYGFGSDALWMAFDDSTRCQCYKTFYGRKLQIFNELERLPLSSLSSLV